MSLREEYDQAVREKNAEAKREEDLRAMDRLLPEEVRNLYKHYWLGWNQELCEGGLYYYSRSIQLPPESQALIDELIELCPPQCWEAPPTEVTVCKCKRPSQFAYIDETYYSCSTKDIIVQYQVPDGSTHIGEFKVSVSKAIEWIEPKHRFTRKGKEEAAEEAKALSEQRAKEAALTEGCRIWDESFLHNPMVTGSLEYFKAGSFNCESDMFVFRDGTVYVPMPLTIFDNDRHVYEGERMTERFLATPASVRYIRDVCTEQVKKWAAMA